MMRVLLFILTICSSNIFAQYQHDYTWLFGYGDPMYNGTTVSFNNDTLTIDYEPREVSFYLANTMMSKMNGELLFYSNGCRLYNYNHEMLINGDSINIGASDFLYNQGCDEDGIGYGSGHQTMLSIPFDDKYYIFHEALTLQEEPLSIHQRYLFYSLISFENSEQGEVLEKNISLLPQDTLLLGGQLTAVKHHNAIDWWIIKHDQENNLYYKFLLDDSGIQLDDTQEIGLINAKIGGIGGAAVFSPDGTQYAKFSPEDGLYVMDFDRATGMLSNFRNIKMEKEGIFGSVCFSPSGRYLYINDRLYLYQFDMEAEDLESGKVFIAEMDSFIGNELGQFTTFGRMQLGPDCRIYMNTGTATYYLHVIMNPDEKGDNCDLRQHSVKLPTLHGRSMPHYPNYRLDTGYPVCDDSKEIVLSTKNTSYQSEKWSVYPNPTQDYIYLDNLPSGSSLTIYDIMGNAVYQSIDIPSYHSISVHNWTKGIYIATIQDKSGRMDSKKFIVR